MTWYRLSTRIEKAECHHGRWHHPCSCALYRNGTATWVSHDEVWCNKEHFTALTSCNRFYHAESQFKLLGPSEVVPFPQLWFVKWVKTSASVVKSNNILFHVSVGKTLGYHREARVAIHAHNLRITCHSFCDQCIDSHIFVAIVFHFQRITDNLDHQLFLCLCCHQENLAVSPFPAVLSWSTISGE